MHLISSISYKVKTWKKQDFWKTIESLVLAIDFGKLWISKIDIFNFDVYNILVFLKEENINFVWRLNLIFFSILFLAIDPESKFVLTIHTEIVL